MLHQQKQKDLKSTRKAKSSYASAVVKVKKLKAVFVKLESKAGSKGAASATQKLSEQSAKKKLVRAQKAARMLQRQVQRAETRAAQAVQKTSVLVTKVKEDEQAEAKQKTKIEAATEVKEAAAKSKQAALAKMVEEKAQKRATVDAQAASKKEAASRNTAKTMVSKAKLLAKQEGALAGMAAERQRKAKVTAKELAKLTKASTGQTEDEQALKWKAKADEVKQKKTSLVRAANKVEHDEERRGKRSEKKKLHAKKVAERKEETAMTTEKQTTKSATALNVTAPLRSTARSTASMSKASASLAALHHVIASTMGGRRRNFARNEGIGRGALSSEVSKRVEEVVKSAAHGAEATPPKQHEEPSSPKAPAARGNLKPRRANIEKPRQVRVTRQSKASHTANVKKPRQASVRRQSKASKGLQKDDKVAMEREVKAQLARGMNKLLGPSTLEIAAGYAGKKRASTSKEGQGAKHTRTTDGRQRLGEGHTMPFRAALDDDTGLFGDAGIASDGVPLDLGAGFRQGVR